MGIVHRGIPIHLALKLQSLFGIRYFVETGTYLGNTAAWASKYFERVYTIEASEDLWQQTSQRYKNVENIGFLQGNSAHVEGIMIRLMVQHFLVDAHWSGDVTTGKVMNALY